MRYPPFGKLNRSVTPIIPSLLAVGVAILFFSLRRIIDQQQVTAHRLRQIESELASRGAGGAGRRGLVRNMAGWKKPYLLGLLQGRVFEQAVAATQKGRRGLQKKSHAAWSMNQVVEPEAGRMIQSPMINLVSGVVTRSLAAADGLRDRVGSCGA